MSSTSPVTHFVTVSKLPNKGMVVKAEADAEQRAALARAHDLQDVEHFVYNLHLAPWKGRGVRIRGDVSALIVQPCAVTLEPVRTSIDEAVETVFVPEDSRLARPQIVEGELIVSPEGDDVPETFAHGRIDVGALAEEFFELAIPLYPRQEGAELLDGTDGKASPANEAQNPFAVLSTLKPH
ncbi:DUF177 domain-containing protein [Notoacmeibacter sp. MSK16QG-6]|uniref:YceD family protein n=1 Tax=Notoacmeibacter sp. MSK16QG-6 TaxID=2957982 RepID=UPI0020A1EF70|nr:DUF177 domain-containing protein [Notoacmeibacter sp. MSK16QG-6]MCP1198450.1 DUF177 domain-containing protein [Notoacmeibacter sp. MSK16QG-6]